MRNKKEYRIPITNSIILGPSNLPSEFDLKTCYLLAPWSILKHPKKWMNNKRLNNKFNKNWEKYVPWSIRQFYANSIEWTLTDKYKEAFEEICKNEDEKLFDLLRRLK